MKRLSILCILMLLLTSATCQHKNKYDTESIMISYNDTLNIKQLDSLIVADTLSPNVKKDWITSFSITRNRETLYKYVYIKRLGKNREIIYTLNQYQDSLFLVSKRITKQK